MCDLQKKKHKTHIFMCHKTLATPQKKTHTDTNKLKKKHKINEMKYNLLMAGFEYYFDFKSVIFLLFIKLFNFVKGEVY